MEKSTPIIVFGASGRTGSRVCEIALIDERVRLIGAVVREGSPRIGQRVRGDDVAATRFVSPGNAGDTARSCGEVVIDFSSDSGARAALGLALARGAALLIGTTALGEETLAMLRAASEKISLCITSNTSLGVCALSVAVSGAARMLGPAFECSIVEAHHSKKKDAPSGTALRLARAAREGGASLRDDQVLSLRGGEVIGEHTVRFAGPGEYIELTHRATSRDVFALGAIHAARWLSGRAPGLYTIEDVLGVGARSPHDRG